MKYLTKLYKSMFSTECVKYPCQQLPALAVGLYILLVKSVCIKACHCNRSALLYSMHAARAVDSLHTWNRIKKKYLNRCCLAYVDLCHPNNWSRDSRQSVAESGHDNHPYILAVLRVVGLVCERQAVSQKPKWTSVIAWSAAPAAAAAACCTGMHRQDDMVRLVILDHHHADVNMSIVHASLAAARGPTAC